MHLLIFPSNRFMLTDNHCVIPICFAQANGKNPYLNLNLWRKKTMLKTMNQEELMSVNGGFYYVPVYYYKITWSGSYYYRKLIKTGTEQVASNSGIKKIEVIDGRRSVVYY